MMLRPIQQIMVTAHISCNVAGDRGDGGWGRGGREMSGGVFLSDGAIIRNISVKEFLYYIRCEANCFLEKRSNQGRSGDGDIEEDSESKTHDSKRRRERSGGSRRGRWSRVVKGLGRLCLHVKAVMETGHKKVTQR